MGTTPDLGLPELSQAQANPEITFNEALFLLQAYIMGVIDKDLTAPPGSPTEGDTYLINTASPTGLWAGHARAITIYTGGSWRFLPGNNDAGTPIPLGTRHEGLQVYVKDENAFYEWSGSAWAIATSGGGTAATTTFTPAGNISATNVQAAIQELDSEKIAIAGHAATSVIGRSANSTGDAADIAFTTNDRLLGRVSNVLGETQLTNGMVPTNTVGLDKLVNASAQYNIMARTSASAGAWEQKASSSDVFAILGAANNAAIRTLLGLGAAALLGVASASDARAMTSTSVLLTPANLNDRVAFDVTKNADQTGIANDTYTKVTWQSESANGSFDDGGAFDLANSRFIAPAAGRYRFSGMIRPTGILPSTGLIITLYVNGSIIRNINVVDTGSGGGWPSGTALLKLAANDVVEMYAYGSTSTTWTIFTGYTWAYFQGEVV